MGAAAREPAGRAATRGVGLKETGFLILRANYTPLTGSSGFASAAPSACDFLSRVGTVFEDTNYRTWFRVIHNVLDQQEGSRSILKLGSTGNFRKVRRK